MLRVARYPFHSPEPSVTEPRQSESHLSEPHLSELHSPAIDTPARLAILGAGPIGLEAALYARFLGYDLAVFERGHVAERLRSRRHLPTLQPFERLCSPLGVAALSAQTESFRPLSAQHVPTVGEWLDIYLLPLAASDLLADHIHESTEVLAVGRAGFLRGEMVDDPERGDYAFRVLVRDGRGVERIEEFDGVLDASGAGCAAYCGESGIPAIGELAARQQSVARLLLTPPDFTAAEAARFQAKRIVIVGETIDAALSLRGALQFAERFPDTKVTWITRRVVEADGPGPIAEPDPSAGDDVLAMVRQANAHACHPRDFDFLSGTAIHALGEPLNQSTANDSPWHLTLVGQHAGTRECDWLLVHTGERVDDRIASELNIRRCPATGRITDDALDTAIDHQTHAPTPSVTRWWSEPHYHVLGAKRVGRQTGWSFWKGLDDIRRLFALLGDRPSLDLYAARTRQDRAVRG